MAVGQLRGSLPTILGSALAGATVCVAAWIAISLLGLSTLSLPTRFVDLRLASKAQIAEFLSATNSRDSDSDFHSEQDFDEGNHRSATTTVPCRHCCLYSSNRAKRAHPASAMDRDNRLLRIIPATCTACE